MHGCSAAGAGANDSALGSPASGGALAEMGGRTYMLSRSMRFWAHWIELWGRGASAARVSSRGAIEKTPTPDRRSRFGERDLCLS